MGTYGLDTEPTVHLNTEIPINTLCVQQYLLVMECVFCCEKCKYVSIRGPPSN